VAGHERSATPISTHKEMCVRHPSREEAPGRQAVTNLEVERDCWKDWAGEPRTKERRIVPQEGAPFGCNLGDAGEAGARNRSALPSLSIKGRGEKSTRYTVHLSSSMLGAEGRHPLQGCPSVCP
jgi:hypothetical protein